MSAQAGFMQFPTSQLTKTLLAQKLANTVSCLQ